MIAIGHQAALAVEDTRYYSAMVQAERLAAVGQTIAMLSHHIKNILQGIRGGSYLIEMGLSSHDEDVVRKGWDIVERIRTRSRPWSWTCSPSARNASPNRSQRHEPGRRRSGRVDAVPGRPNCTSL